MKELILFGNGKIAQVVHHYLSRSPEIRVRALTVDREYCAKVSWCDLPVIPFDEIATKFPPAHNLMFVAVGYQQNNRLRTKTVGRVKELGYRLHSYLDPDSGAPSDFQYGENCFVMNHQNIQPGASIGDNVFVWSGATIGHHTRIESNCWITSAASIAGNVLMEEGSFVGINVTVGDSIRIGKNCILGAGSIITRCLPDGSVLIPRSTEIYRLNSEQFTKMSSKI